MAKIVKKPVIKRGNVVTVYSNLGSTLEGRLVGMKEPKQRPVKRSPKKIGNI